MLILPIVIFISVFAQAACDIPGFKLVERQAQDPQFLEGGCGAPAPELICKSVVSFADIDKKAPAPDFIKGLPCATPWVPEEITIGDLAKVYIVPETVQTLERKDAQLYHYNGDQEFALVHPAQNPYLTAVLNFVRNPVFDKRQTQKETIPALYSETDKDKFIADLLSNRKPLFNYVVDYTQWHLINADMYISEFNKAWADYEEKKAQYNSGRISGASFEYFKKIANDANTKATSALYGSCHVIYNPLRLIAALEGNEQNKAVESYLDYSDQFRTILGKYEGPRFPLDQ